MSKNECPLTDGAILEFFFAEGSKFDELENLRKFAGMVYAKGLAAGLERSVELLDEHGHGFGPDHIRAAAEAASKEAE